MTQYGFRDRSVLVLAVMLMICGTEARTTHAQIHQVYVSSTVRNGPTEIDHLSQKKEINANQTVEYACKYYVSVEEEYVDDQHAIITLPNPMTGRIELNGQLIATSVTPIQMMVQDSSKGWYTGMHYKSSYGVFSVYGVVPQGENRLDCSLAGLPAKYDHAMKSELVFQGVQYSSAGPSPLKAVPGFTPSAANGGESDDPTRRARASRAVTPSGDEQPKPPARATGPILPGPFFSTPTWNGKRVDLCLVWGGQCGAPAAAEFCKRSGYNEANAWKPANDIGVQTPTIVLSSGQVCSDSFCDGFDSITCSK